MRDETLAARWVMFVGRACGYHPEEYRLATLDPAEVPSGVWEDVAQNWMEVWTVVGVVLTPLIALLGLGGAWLFDTDAPFMWGFTAGCAVMGLAWSESLLTWCRRAYWRARGSHRPALFRRSDVLLQVGVAILSAIAAITSFS